MNSTTDLIHQTIANLTALEEKTRPFRQAKVERKIKELKQFCDNLDPYKKLTEEDISFLKKHHIYPPYDPFIITNKLLLELESAIEELAELKDETK